MTFQASLSMESLSLSGGSAQDRLWPRDANNRCWKNTNMNMNYDSFWPVCRLQMCVCHLGKSSFITVFDHANKVCRSRCDKFCPECPHDRVQQESTMGKWMNITNSNINAAVVNSVLDFSFSEDAWPCKSHNHNASLFWVVAYWSKVPTTKFQWYSGLNGIFFFTFF